MEILSLVVSLIVAIIAGFSAWAAQRSSAQANQKAAQETSRVDLEKEAYERARAFDTETIRRQNRRIAELAREVRRLERRLKELEDHEEGVSGYTYTDKECEEEEAAFQEEDDFYTDTDDS